MGGLFLYGPPASGKTTLGRLLSERLGAPFRDLDDEIVRAAGRSVPEIFSAEIEGIAPLFVFMAIFRLAFPWSMSMALFVLLEVILLS